MQVFLNQAYIFRDMTSQNKGAILGMSPYIIFMTYNFDFSIYTEYGIAYSFVLHILCALSSSAPYTCT